MGRYARRMGYFATTEALQGLSQPSDSGNLREQK
jgi:hypothetical protein